MKNCILALVILAIAGGIAWGQVVDATKDVMSVENRYSAGQFSSDVDNYIDPNFYDPQIGKFIFMGGYGTANTAGPVPGSYVSAGFGKTLGNNYLGLFYAAEAVNASGYHYDKNTKPADTHKDNVDYSKATWNNRLAVLFGTANMGFRFDMTLNNLKDDRTTVDGTLYEQTTTATEAAIGLSWGTMIKTLAFAPGGLAPFVSLGIYFPDVTTRSDLENKKHATKSEGGLFGLEVGAWLGLKDDQELGVGLGLEFGFADSVKGDKDVIPVLSNDGRDEEYTVGGSFIGILRAEYMKPLTFGEATIKFMPYMELSLGSISTNDSRDDKTPSVDTFNLNTGLKIGGEYKHGKIGLYTSVGLEFFDWTVNYHTGGKDENKDSTWTFTGLKWTTSVLQFGLTFTPTEGLVFGAGITAPVTVDLQKMQIGVTRIGEYSVVGPTYAITASYKF